MFSCKKSSDKIDKLNKRVLKTTDLHYTSSYQGLINKNNETAFYIEHTNIALQVYKIHYDLNPPFIKVFFLKKVSVYSLKVPNELRWAGVSNFYLRYFQTFPNALEEGGPFKIAEGKRLKNNWPSTKLRKFFLS